MITDQIMLHFLIHFLACFPTFLPHWSNNHESISKKRIAATTSTFMKVQGYSEFQIQTVNKYLDQLHRI